MKRNYSFGANPVVVGVRLLLGIPDGRFDGLFPRQSSLFLHVGAAHDFRAVTKPQTIGNSQVSLELDGRFLQVALVRIPNQRIVAETARNDMIERV